MYLASRSANFTIKEMFLINVLGSRQSATMSELAQVLSVPLTAMTGIVARLVKRGYLDRFRTEEDRRVVLVSLSEQGREIFQQHGLGGKPMIAVTGPTGHIGNVLVRELLKRGERVRALVLPGEDLTPIQGLDTEMVEGDILDLDSLIRAFEGVDAVYHLAGVISIVPGEWDRLYKVNVVGTQNVIRACSACGVRRLVYASSIHAFAEPSPGVTFDETSPFDPGKLSMEYDRSKAMATLEVLEAVEKGLDAVVACPTGVMGPYDYRLSEMGRLIRTGSLSSKQMTTSRRTDSRRLYHRICNLKE
jgi:DNA-binding MarR family transcriptional regulator